MADNMGGSSTARVPAWKLRQQQRPNGRLPSALNVNDELGGTRSSASRPRGGDELGGTKSGSIPAWKLREQRKNRGGDNFDDDSSSVVSTGSTRSNVSLVSRASVSSNISCHPSRTMRPVSRVPGAPDPSLPPAFRAAFGKQQARKKDSDDFTSLSSVHSRSRTDACSYTHTNGSDSFGSLDSDSIESQDSFASIESDADEDDDAYRESRNQMARLEIEKQKRTQDAKRSRFKKKSLGVHGQPLDFIAE